MEETPNNTVTDAVSEEAIGPRIGELLSAERVRRKKELPDVSAALRISLRYLQAIEEGHYENLPGLAYAHGFIRSYAAFLDLDPEEFVRQFKRETAAAEEEGRLEFPSPVPERSVPGGALIFIGLVLAGVAYGVVHFMSDEADDVTTGEVVAEVADNTASDEPQPIQTEEMSETPSMASMSSQPSDTPSEQAEVQDAVETAVETSVETVVETATASDAPAPSATTAVSADDGVAQPAVESTAESVAEAVVEPAAEVAAEPVAEIVAEPVVEPVAEAVVEPVVAPASETVAEPVVESSSAPEVAAAVEAVAEQVAEPVTTPATNTKFTNSREEGGADARVVVQAEQSSWVEVRDLNARTILFSRLLRVGESYRVPNRSGLVLRTGNAGALAIDVDGARAPAIGTPGQVVRDVKLDAELLAAGNAR